MRHVARKRFGQHFLTDTGIIGAIVRAIDPRPGEAVIEIGPGLGALTTPLAERCSDPPLSVIEIDRDLATHWRRQSDHGARVTVIEADVLGVDFTELSRQAGRPLRLVGNLPYNISSPILFHLLSHVDAVVDQHFMLQKEVVDRMAAGPGSKTYGRLSVMLQWRYDIEALFDVPPESFDPPPKVESAVVRMTPRHDASDVDVARLGEVVTLAFSQRRKILRHTLGPWLAQHGGSEGFDLQRRAEEVAPDEFIALARRP